MKRTTKYVIAVATVATLTMAYTAPASAFWWLGGVKTTIDSSRHNSHDVGGNVSNSVMGNYQATAGNFSGASIGKRSSVMNVGGIHGDKNNINMSSSGYFGVGSQETTTNYHGAVTNTNTNSNNSQ